MARSTQHVYAILSLGLFGFISGCAEQPVASLPEADSCAIGFGPWERSLYVLPFPPGHAYRMSQGNCAKTVGAHGGKRRFAYDFDMPIGAFVIAARSGTVEVVIERWPDVAGGRGQDNMVRINHGDGSFADYVHLREAGVVVDVGAVVSQGDTLAQSGNSGFSAGPHLHFHVELYGTCTPNDPATGLGGCQSVAINFRNTTPNPTGLTTGRVYRAEPW